MERTFRETSLGKVSYLWRKGKEQLIFLHGLGGSSNNWLRLPKFLKDRYSLYFLDLLGHGRTVSGNWNYSIRDQCRMLEEFIDESGFQRFALAGNSYGGWVAATYAARFGTPEYLILEDSAGLNSTIGQYDRERMERFIDRLQSSGRMNDRETMRKIMIQNSTGEERLRGEDMKAIRARTLVIWGSEDRVIDVSYGKALAASIIGCRLEIIDGAGHVPHYTHPARTAQIINDFVSFEAV